MDWTAGYASDIEYTAGLYKEQSPAYLNFVCALNGIEAPSLERPFNYFELGFGRGLTANVLAASNPNGTFYAADFNPSHVAGARALAEAAQLSNLTLLENSFEELAQGKAAGLPQFDYITLHGIYTWVTAENRRHIVDFIGRYLKPGGVVYLSYNAMPGWAATLPLQRLLVEFADAFPNRSDVQIDGAAAFTERMAAAQAGYFTNNPSLAKRLETLKTGSRNYLVHEYMHKHWQPLYHADVARDLADAKMDFAGSAELSLTFTKLYLNPERQALLDAMPDSAMRETLKDYILNTTFRKDVFVRGARKMSPLRRAEVLAQLSVALLVPRDAVKFTMKTAFGELTGNAPLYGAVSDALAGGPRTLAELGALPALRSEHLETLVQVATVLAASGQAALYFQHSGEVHTVAAHRMNRALAAQVRYGDEYHALGSPVLRNGIAVNYFERMAYGMLAEKAVQADAGSMAAHAWKVMSSMGRKVAKEGVALESEADNIAELRQLMEVIVRDKVPLWQQLKML